MGICSLIVAVWGVIKIVKEIKKPSDDLKTKVDKHTEFLDNTANNALTTANNLLPRSPSSSLYPNTAATT